MYEIFTDRARKVMQLANQEAQRFNHEYIGTEHILLALIKEGSGVASSVLRELGIEFIRVRLEIEKLVQSGPDMVTMGKLPQTPRAKKVIEYSMEESRNLNHTYVGTEHILLGLLREEEGVAAQVLLNLEVYLDDVREHILDLLGPIDAGQGKYRTWKASPVPLRELSYAKLKERIERHDKVMAEQYPQQDFIRIDDYYYLRIGYKRDSIKYKSRPPDWFVLLKSRRLELVTSVLHTVVQNHEALPADQRPGQLVISAAMFDDFPTPQL